MVTIADTQTAIDAFIQRWEHSGASERANCQLFLSELCDLLDLPRPDPAMPETAENAYVFERAVTFQNADGTTAPGRIDLYKRGCFVLEAKQGSEQATPGGRTGSGRRGTPGWEQSMLRARAQADRYIRALTAFIQTDGRPLDLPSITKAFKGARKPKVREILDALTDLGRLTQIDATHWQG